ncbi:MAG: substrate-binding domain-containing protein [Cyanobacteria bacterium]|nr:substrate-binding domain-containing protein [Cyanobacteriota bacterium]
MAKQSGGETLMLLLALFLTLGTVGVGVLWIWERLQSPDAPPLAVNGTAAPTANGTTTAPTANGTTATPTAPLPSAPILPAQRPEGDRAVAPGTVLRIVGSTSMAQINRLLEPSLRQAYPQMQISAQAGGTEQGLAALLDGSADVGGISRPLEASELASGLQVVPLARDAIAVVVGQVNSFRGSLSRAQVAAIFQTTVTDWDQVGRSPGGPIRVINRPANSGTHQAFRELALGSAPFGSGPGLQTLDRDATTPLLRALGADGIGYATYAQVANQSTVRVLAINGRDPSDPAYPFQRTLSYAYRYPPSPAVRAFLTHLQSPEARAALGAE